MKEGDQTPATNPGDARPMIKRVVSRILSSRAVAPLWAPLSSGHLTIFTLHRFSPAGFGLDGHDPALLRKTLERLRRDRYEIVGLKDAIRRLQNSPVSFRRTVAFTIDDGYCDIAEDPADVFLAYDCPVTVFVSTGFVNGEHWHWWDQIEWVCLSTRKKVLTVHLGDSPLTLFLGDDVAHRRWLVRDLWERCKRVPDDAMWRFIRLLASEAEVAIPERAPRRYAPLTWSDIRSLERRGFCFGPHGVSHPVLSQTTKEDSERQIVESWAELRRHLDDPVAVFAYPNGGQGDFGMREIETIARVGLVAAVTTQPGYVSAGDFTREATARYQIPRFPYPGDTDRVCLVASGFMRIRRPLRAKSRERRPWISVDRRDGVKLIC